jgi:hypothetical protein
MAGFVLYLNRCNNFVEMCVTYIDGIKTILIQYLFAPSINSRLIFRQTGDVVLTCRCHHYIRICWQGDRQNAKKKTSIMSHFDVVT